MKCIYERAKTKYNTLIYIDTKRGTINKQPKEK